MKRAIVIPIVALASIMVNGCMTVRSFVDPSFPKASLVDIRQIENPQRVRLAVEFQTNGKFNERATQELLQKSVWVLKDTRLFSSVETSGSDDIAVIDILMNNIGDIGKAARKGALTGLTFGAAGSMVTDGYLFTAGYKPVGREAVKKVYEHAIHSTVGNAKGPEGLEPMSTQQAFYQVVEHLLLNFVRELQAQGYLLGK